MREPSFPFVVLLFAWTASACGPPGNHVRRSSEHVIDGTTRSKNGAHASDGASAVDLAECAWGSRRRLRWAFHGDSLSQILDVMYLDQSTIEFALSRNDGCRRSESGRAHRKRGDLESDEDEAGAAYFVDEYSMKRDESCTIYLRIELRSARRAAVTESSGCSQACPFASDVTMIRDD